MNQTTTMAIDQLRAQGQREELISLVHSVEGTLMWDGLQDVIDGLSRADIKTKKGQSRIAEMYNLALGTVSPKTSVGKLITLFARGQDTRHHEGNYWGTPYLLRSHTH